MARVLFRIGISSVLAGDIDSTSTACPAQIEILNLLRKRTSARAPAVSQVSPHAIDPVDGRRVEAETEISRS
jgi:hypothetical protein